MAIWHQKLNLPFKDDYIRPSDSRTVIPWNLHPKATRGKTLVPSDLTAFMPPVGNQDRIGACSGYGTKDAIATSLSKSGHVLPGYLAALPLYRATRCLERAGACLDPATNPLVDSGASPDDVCKVMSSFGAQTTLDECGLAGPCDALSQYENEHVNDEPTLHEFEMSDKFKVAGAFDIVSIGSQRIIEVATALASGYAVGISVYAADDRFQSYTGGVMPNPPSREQCDHWNYLVGLYLDATQTPIFVGVNSWTTGWGQGWGKAVGGLWLGGPAIIHAADCLIAYAVKEVSP